MKIARDLESKINVKLEHWKAKLLDFSRKNPQVNFKPESKSVIEVIYPDVYEVFNRLFISNLSVYFPPVYCFQSEGSLDDDLNNGGGDNGGSENRLRNEALEKERFKTALHKKMGNLKKSEILSKYDDLELERRLKNRYQKTQLWIEEQGINSLHLCLGLLKWKENVKESAVLYSPLLFIPLKIEPKRKEQPFRLSVASMEIVVNKALLEKLWVSHGISLPNLPEEIEDMQPIEGYFEALRSKIVNKSGWEVQSRCFIANLVFAKILLYKDLEDNHVAISRHPILRVIFGGSKYLNELPSIKISEDELGDNYSSENYYCILDSDSSQYEAIQYAKKGCSFVIQGPPGTGKSQCIANMIAEFLALNKTVLFVSQKKAALDVVKARLDKCYIGKFCLELHSNKLKKDGFLREIQQIMGVRLPDCGYRFDFDEFNEKRQMINSYISNIHARPLDKSSASIYGVMGKLLEMAKIPLIDGIFFSGSKLHDSQFIKLKKLFEVIDGYTDYIENWDKNPWNSTKLKDFEDVSSVKLSDIEGLLEEFLRVILGLKSETLQFLSKHESESNFKTMWDRYRYLVNYWSGCMGIIYAWRELKGVRNKMGGFFFLNVPMPLGSSLHKIEAYDFDVFEKDLKTCSDAISVLMGSLRGFEQKYCIKSIKDWDDVNRWKGFLEVYKPEAFNLNLSEMIDAFSSRFVGFGRFFKLQYYRYKILLRKVFRTKSIDKKCKEIDHLRCIKDFRDRNFCSLVNVDGDFQISFSSHLDLFKSVENQKRVFEFLSDLTPLEQIMKSEEWDTHKAFYDEWKNNLSSLHNYLEILKIFNELKKKELSAFIEKIINKSFKGVSYSELFEKAYYSNVLRELLNNYPYIQNFNKNRHEALISKFSDSDRKLSSVNIHRVCENIIKNRPCFDGLLNQIESSEVMILKKEFLKKRNIKPIREILAKAKNFITGVAPCFMMSPLSVVNYLPLEHFDKFFDVVIFDEASQINPEDAISTILRGKQIIVVGDNKQLPPTSFFSKEMEEDNEEEEETLESILDECLGSGLPQKKLIWHYRSRRESLIAFSNQHFYNNELYTFPDALNPNERDKGNSIAHLPGLEFVYVQDGLYENRKNKVEARKVVESIVEHYKNYPNYSLGVVAFSSTQQEAIISELERIKKIHPEVENLIPVDAQEELFIKNLETVQGDERDFIFFSIGYGRNNEGKMLLNFGPLNQKNGGRRLNVAITRARYHNKIFCSFIPSQIDLSNSKSEGLRLLFKYLEFARTGKLIQYTQTNGKELQAFDSYFEEDVYNELIAAGYRVDNQVGCSGYRIDLAVINPSNPYEYILGIECDGKSYHSLKTARDRDRLRHEILERLGWKIYHIWSPEWFKDKKKVLEEIQNLIEARLTKKTETDKKDSLTIKPKDPPEIVPLIQELLDLIDFTNNDDCGDKKNKEDFRKKFLSLPCVKTYKKAKIPLRKVSQEMLQKEFYSSENRRLVNIIEMIINNEGPIHEELLIKRLLEIYNFKKSGKQILSIIKNALYYFRDKLNNGFYVPDNVQEDLIRIDRDGQDDRNLFQISDMEIKNVFKILINEAMSLNKRDLYKNTINLFNLRCTKEKYTERLDPLLMDLVNSNFCRIVNDRIELIK